MTIEEIRKEIDKIDDKITILLVERLNLAKNAAIAKKSCERNPDREKQIIERVKKSAPDSMKNSIATIYETIIEKSVQYQTEQTKEK